MNKKEIINTLLVDLFNHILRIEEESLQKLGVKLTMTEVHVLEAIELSENKTMTEVANRLNITLGTLTTSINRLVRKNMVIKTRNKTDKRVYNLSLTNEALDVLKVHDQFHDEMIQALLDDLMIDEDDLLISSLENISNYFKKRDKKEVK
ncbi:MAG: MarR family transcriptional regulator [Acholeplasmataceae bacterium]|jgi:DNA-binding MarR family transcriptional regulator|nr:MarR family transcriptional regulator [Acholeplasmataceae bacterium]